LFFPALVRFRGKTLVSCFFSMIEKLAHYTVPGWHTYWHVLRSPSWGACLSATALIVGIGAFLDEYYVGEGSRDAVRQRIQNFLQSLDDPRSRMKDLIQKFKESARALALTILAAVLFGIMYAIWKWLPGGHFVVIILSLIVVPGLPLIFLLWIPLLMMFVVGIICFIASLTFKFVELIISAVFRPAADPKRSPFKFATGMVGLWVLIAKFGLELAK
jgi:ABC-type uncharacterized transport system fused permease/ATPase subunit